MLKNFAYGVEESYWQKDEDTVCMLGFCDMHSVLEVAKRVKENDMHLMPDIHYSDHFADPEHQDIPETWIQDDEEQLINHVYQHTKDALSLFTTNNIYPEWVQVGNEINNGIF